jgi:hypothetical protein
MDNTVEKDAQYFINQFDNLKVPSAQDISKKMVEGVKNTFVGTYAEIERQIEKAKEDAKEEYSKAMVKYWEDRKKIDDDFKLYLFKKLGTDNNEINEIIYNQATEDKDYLVDVEYAFEKYADMAESIMRIIRKK